MALVLIDDTYLKDTAGAIRDKNGKSVGYKPAAFAEAIGSLGGAACGLVEVSGSSLSVSGLGFKPDFVLLCARKASASSCYVYLDSEGYYMRVNSLAGFSELSAGHNKDLTLGFTMTEDGFTVSSGNMALAAELYYVAQP